MRDYEIGMTIIFDIEARSTFIDFRGQFYYLIGPFFNRNEAVAAGEAKCRELGWHADEDEAA
jgi:hypothetical protein